MGDLAPGDRALLKRRLGAERSSGRLLLPVREDLSYADGSLGAALAKRGYRGSFIWTSDPLRSGRRMIELLDADDAKAWDFGE